MRSSPLRCKITKNLAQYQIICEVFLGSDSTLGCPLLQACLGKADVGHGLINSLELAFVHFKVVQVAAAEPRTPVVGTQKGALLVQVYIACLASLNLLPLVFSKVCRY